MDTNIQIFFNDEFGDIRVRVYPNNDIDINLEDSARGLGFVEVKPNRVATSGDKPYAAIRWARVKGYLDSFGYTGEVNKDAYIPGHIFYRLAMKANNAAAERFQDLIARVIIPSIRKRSYCMTTKTVEDNKPVGNPEFPPELSKLWAGVKTGEALVEAAKLTTDRKFREAIVREAVRVLTGGKLVQATKYDDDICDWDDSDDTNFEK